MRAVTTHALLASLVALSTATCAEDAPPKVAISNGQVRAEVMLPDSQRGFYRGTRFDWSGIVSKLEFAGHEFIAPWKQFRGPLVHDDVTGPAEEFLTNDSALGYDETPAGGAFPRIGVGALRKPEEKTYRRFETYEIADPGTWSIRKSNDRVEISHRLSTGGGYAYLYRKTVILPKGQARMEIRHSLRNTGRKGIDTVQYSHNFWVIDQQVVGPDMVVEFPFAPKPSRQLPFGADVQGRAIVYTRNLETGQTSSADVTGYSSNARDYDIRVENRKAGAGVHITSDTPLAQLHFWSIRAVACPEPYVHVRVLPGETRTWTLRYDLYTLPTTGGRVR
jgi:hypothetical protein